MIEKNEVLGTWLATRLALNTRYFSKLMARSSSTLNRQISVKKYGGLIFVSIPSELKRYLDDDKYIVSRISGDEHVDDYEYVFEITKDTKIGFWK